MIADNPQHFRILVFGGSDEANEGTIARIRNIGSFAIGDSSQITDSNFGEIKKNVIQKIVSEKINLLILCLGQPRQEFFASGLQKDGVTIPICCLGAFTDFASGKRRRSPRVINKIGLEWCWRLCTEPRRLWRRYFFFSIRGLFSLVFEWKGFNN